MSGLFRDFKPIINPVPNNPNDIMAGNNQQHLFFQV
jgi:hypothetical protein